jgi:hypothetical protein
MPDYTHLSRDELLALAQSLSAVFREIGTMTEPHVIYWRSKSGGKVHHGSPITWPSLEALDSELKKLNADYPQLVHWAYPASSMGDGSGSDAA